MPHLRLLSTFLLLGFLAVPELSAQAKYHQEAASLALRVLQLSATPPGATLPLDSGLILNGHRLQLAQATTLLAAWTKPLTCRRSIQGSQLLVLCTPTRPGSREEFPQTILATALPQWCAEQGLAARWSVQFPTDTLEVTTGALLLLERNYRLPGESTSGGPFQAPHPSGSVCGLVRMTLAPPDSPRWAADPAAQSN